MLRSTLLLLLSISSGIHAKKYSLYANKIGNRVTSDPVTLGDFEYDPELKSLTALSDVTAVRTENVEDGALYCISAEVDDTVNYPCFSLLELTLPLRYNFVVATDPVVDEILKLSLVYNETVDGIVPTVMLAVDAPLPPAAKLKKVTKTYADLKKEKDNLNAAAPQLTDDDFDEENAEENQSWMKKNWRKLVVGFIIYNVIAVIGGRNEKMRQDKLQHMREMRARVKAK